MKEGKKFCHAEPDSASLPSFQKRDSGSSPEWQCGGGGMTPGYVMLNLIQLRHAEPDSASQFETKSLDVIERTRLLHELNRNKNYVLIPFSLFFWFLRLTARTACILRIILVSVYVIKNMCEVMK